MQPEGEMGSMGFFFFAKYFSTADSANCCPQEKKLIYANSAQNFVGRIYSALSARGDHDHGARHTRRKKSLELFLAWLLVCMMECYKLYILFANNKISN